MRQFKTTLPAFYRALATLLLLVVLLQPAVASTRTISNTAYLEWGLPGRVTKLSSNRVDLAFSEEAIVQAFLPSLGGIPASALETSCPATVGRDPGGEPNPLADLAATPAHSLYAGGSIILSLTSNAANRDPSVADSISVDIQSNSGDQERLVFLETSNNSSVFLAIIRTQSMPPAAIAGDCKLSVAPGSSLSLELRDVSGDQFGSTTLAILTSSPGVAFDSKTGAPVGGVKITLVDAATGQPAIVYSDDAVSRFPSTVVTGQPVSESGSASYSLDAAGYRFPLVRAGSYRLVVEPASPYTFPSAATSAQLSELRKSDGQPFEIQGGSYGDAFTLTDPGPIRLDLPLDRPATPLVISKSVDRVTAQEGDLLEYKIVVRNPGVSPTGQISIEDHIPSQMRFRGRTARVGGGKAQEPSVTPDRTLIFKLPPLAPGAAETLTYVLEVRPNAVAGPAVNEAQARSEGALSNVADAVVRIERDDIADRFTIIGRVLGGACSLSSAEARGMPGIRVMLEDGSYAVSDYEGRFHFEALKPGTHVVQLDRGSLPPGSEAVDCASDVRSGGVGNSRFVDGLGGELKRVTFRLRAAANSLREATPAAVPSAPPPAMPNNRAGPANHNWLTGQQPGVAFLYPTEATNPQSPVTKVAVKHLKGQQVRLFVNGRAANKIAFEGDQKSSIADVAVSTWRGIPLPGRATELKAEVRDGHGALITTLRQSVIFANVPARVEVVRERSTLLADGIHRPVLAVRITDRGGRPVHQGLAGEFELPEPYYPAMEADAQQARQLAGLERARPTWRVQGDDGIAYVQLEPTTASGTVPMRFVFRDRDIVREERLQVWLSPGDRPWTIVGLAEGTIGFSRLHKHVEKLGAQGSDVLKEGRLALYAKGRVLGRWLLTMSYDSSKQRKDDTFGGVIDPQRYYTVYADRSQRRYDAASIRKLYLRLERPQFYALFGDFNTGIDEPILGRYVRALNGAKAEYASRQVSAAVFAAKAQLGHGREEIQGSGLSGPYALKAHDILPNSERISIQTRDRFRSEKIVDERLLTRHIDYDIDYQRGTITFRSPVLSRSSFLDPQFIIVDYDLDGTADGVLNAGARVVWRSNDRRAQIGATAVREDDGTARTSLIAADVKVRVNSTTEVRAEAALSHGGGQLSTLDSTSHAWLVETEHHGGRLDILAYAGQRDLGFGIGQTSPVENGTRKLGVDARFRLNDALALSASAWHHSRLLDGATSDAARLNAEYRRGDLAGHAGLTFARDDLPGARTATSTLFNAGASKRFMQGRLELGVDSEIALPGKSEAVNFPSRYRLNARFAATRWAALTATYEVASGESVDARTARIGFDLAPWAGARIALSGNMQDISEYGPRSFAALGLQQSIILSKHWSFDASLDSNKTLHGIEPARIIDPLHPVASGGYVGGGSLVAEDFTATTLGATYRSARLSVTGRAEYRRGDIEDRAGLILGAIRQIGEGRALAGSFNWFRAHGRDGSVTSVSDTALTWANRPSIRPLSWLEKLEIRRDAVEGSLVGSVDPLGNPLRVVGDAQSTRLINAFTLNYTACRDRCEFAAFWGARYVSHKFDADDVGGVSNIFAGEGRIAIRKSIEIGAAASVRYGVEGRSLSYSVGPQLGIRPVPNVWLMIGYNFAGYRDRDFASDRFTRSGAYATIRFKFDELSLRSLGLGRH